VRRGLKALLIRGLARFGCRRRRLLIPTRFPTLALQLRLEFELRDLQSDPFALQFDLNQPAELFTVSEDRGRQGLDDSAIAHVGWLAASP
jgi:hypothetical protein